MKIKFFMLLALLPVLFIMACKKEKNEPPFSPNGYWRGSMYLINTAVLNRPDGSCRLYLQFPFEDTGHVDGYKYEGHFTFSNNQYRAYFIENGDTSVIFQSRYCQGDRIEGRAINTGGTSVDFELTKQP